MTRADQKTQSFETALEAARAGAGPDEEPSASRPRIRAALDLAPKGRGSAASWRRATLWADAEEQDLPVAVPGAFQPSRIDRTDSIARELGIGAGLTEAELTQRWRAFLWRNHPDRQPEGARERAGARVAIANALYDRARLARAKA